MSPFERLSKYFEANDQLYKKNTASLGIRNCLELQENLGDSFILIQS